MAGLTLTQYETMLTEAVDNLKATRLSEEYKSADFSLKRSMLDAANRDVTLANNRVIRASRTNTGPRVRRFIPGDG